MDLVNSSGIVYVCPSLVLHVFVTEHDGQLSVNLNFFSSVAFPLSQNIDKDKWEVVLQTRSRQGGGHDVTGGRVGCADDWCGSCWDDGYNIHSMMGVLLACIVCSRCFINSKITDRSFVIVMAQVRHFKPRPLCPVPCYFLSILSTCSCIMCPFLSLLS